MSRDGSGNYTLPVGNPVVSGTIIDVNWANPTMADIAQQLNNVVTRDGTLGPLVPIPMPDGTQALPGVSFKLAPGTGLWREAAKAGYSYNGVAAWYKDSTGIVVPSNITVNSVNTGPLAGFRNRVLNGNFTVVHRGTTFAAPANMTYTLDRWAAYNGAAGRTISRQAGFSGAQYCARVQRDSGNAATGACGIFQPVESTNCYALQGKIATFGFSARAGASLSGTLNAVVYSGTVADQGAAAFLTPGWTGGATLGSLAVPITATETEFSLSVTVPTNALELGVLLYQTYTGTAGGSDYFEVTNIRLEPGAVVTPSEFRPQSIELALCQRYTYDPGYEVTIANRSVGKAFIDFGVNTIYWATINFPVNMRAAPSLVAPTAANFALGFPGSLAISTLVLSHSIPSLAVITGTCAAGTANNNYHLYRPGTTEKLLFVAEL